MKKWIIVVIALFLSGCKTSNANTKQMDISQKEIEINEVDKGKEDIPMKQLYITINNQEWKVNLDSNSTVEAFLQQVPLAITMEELHGNEKYYYLDQRLPTNVKAINQIEAGDVMLYGDNCLVLFYQSFVTTYRYTKIGHIESANSLANIVGKDKIDVNFIMK